MADQEHGANGCVFVTRAVKYERHSCLGCSYQCDIAKAVVLRSLLFTLALVNVQVVVSSLGQPRETHLHDGDSALFGPIRRSCHDDFALEVVNRVFRILRSKLLQDVVV